MTERKLTAVAFSVFLLFAVVTGGFTHAVLTDTEVVTVTLGSGNAGGVGNLATNAVPVANAGPDVSVDANGSVELDGGDSSDADGTVVAYEWVITDGPGSLSAANTATPIYEPPADGGNASSATVELTVTDDEGATATDAATVEIGGIPGDAAAEVARDGDDDGIGADGKRGVS